jgi:hypothetical protein
MTSLLFAQYVILNYCQKYLNGIKFKQLAQKGIECGLDSPPRPGHQATYLYSWNDLWLASIATEMGPTDATATWRAVSLPWGMSW